MYNMGIFRYHDSEVDFLGSPIYRNVRPLMFLRVGEG